MRIRVVSQLATLVAGLCLVRPAAAARFSPYLTAVSVGGGVSDFVRSAYRSDVTPAGAWDVRALIGTRTPVALEVAYVGSALKIHDPGGNDPTLTTTSLEAQARVHLLVWRLQPFLAAGAGWINFHSFGRDQAPIAAREFVHDDNGVVFPMTGGLATYVGEHAMFDARFTYRLAVGSEISPLINQRPDTWMATVRAGYAF